MTYGITVQGESDPILNLVNKVMEEFSAAITPAAFLVDLLPICKHAARSDTSHVYNISAVKRVPSWVPGAGFQRKAKVWSNHRSEMLETPFNLVEEQTVCFILWPSGLGDFLINHRRAGRLRTRSSRPCCRKISQ